MTYVMTRLIVDERDGAVYALDLSYQAKEKVDDVLKEVMGADQFNYVKHPNILEFTTWALSYRCVVESMTVVRAPASRQDGHSPICATTMFGGECDCQKVFKR